MQELTRSLSELALLNRRLRILCLHGYNGSGSALRGQIAHLLPILSYYGDCVFADAPSLMQGDHGWWHARDNGSEVNYQGWDRSRAALIRLFNEQGPFDGVLGFSQGAILTSVLCGLRHPAGQPPTPEYPFSFSFAIMFGGFSARDTQLSKVYDQRDLYKLPSLHVYGTTDMIVNEVDSMKLARRFDGPRIIIHGGGHIVPSFWKFKETLGYFVKEQFERKGRWLDQQFEQSMAAQATPTPPDRGRALHDDSHAHQAQSSGSGAGLLVPGSADRGRSQSRDPSRSRGASREPSPSPGPVPHTDGEAHRQSGTLTIPLWASGPTSMRVVFPKGHHAQASPILVVFRGGAYSTARGSGEGTVEWAAARGFLAVEVEYGTASTHRYYPDNFADAARAIRLVRSRAKVWNANPDRLALLGYSAGAHLAALVATRPKMHRNYEDDLFDKFSARPNLLILAYGVLSFVDGYHPNAYVRSVNNFFGSDEAFTHEYRQQFSAEYLVDHKTPPTFVWTVERDVLVPPSQSKLFADAMKAQGRDVEYKLYKTGAHGVGLALHAGGDVEGWTQSMLHWVESHWGGGGGASSGSGGGSSGGRKHFFKDLFHKH